MGRVRVVVLGSVGGVAGLVVSRFVRDIIVVGINVYSSVMRREIYLRGKGKGGMWLASIVVYI